MYNKIKINYFSLHLNILWATIKGNLIHALDLLYYKLITLKKETYYQAINVLHHLITDISVKK